VFLLVEVPVPRAPGTALELGAFAVAPAVLVLLVLTFLVYYILIKYYNVLIIFEIAGVLGFWGFGVLGFWGY